MAGSLLASWNVRREMLGLPDTILITDDFETLIVEKYGYHIVTITGVSDFTMLEELLRQYSNIWWFANSSSYYEVSIKLVIPDEETATLIALRYTK